MQTAMQRGHLGSGSPSARTSKAAARGRGGAFFFLIFFLFVSL
jgi:hypothetical protein